MKKLICALIGAAALVVSAATYIQTSPTGTAPWKPVKDSVSLAHLADSARHAPPSAYADSSRTSGLADSAKRAGWAPLDSGRVRGIVSDTAATLRTGMGAYIPLAGSDNIAGSLSSFSGYSLGSLAHPWGYSFFRELAIDSLGDRRLYIEYNGAINWGKGGFAGPSIYCDWGADPYRHLHIGGGNPVYVDNYWISSPQFIVRGGTAKGFLKADGSVDSSGVFAGVTDSARASHISDSAKALAHYGTLAQDTAIAKKVASDTATALRTYIGSASTTGNAATATKLAAARTIATSGDVTGTPTAFDGTANITIPTTLPTLLNAGSAGSAAAVPTLTWDAKGRLTAVGSAAISIPHTQISDWGTYINQPLLTTSSPTFGNANIGTMIGYPNNAWFGYSGLNTGTNYSGFYQTNTSDIGIAALSGHGVYLQVAQAQILDILGNGIIAHQPISANSGINAKAVNFPGGLSVTSSSATLTANSPRLIKVNYNGLTFIHLPAPTDGLEFEVLSSGEYSVACVNITAPSSVVFTQGSGSTSGPSANTSNVCANYARHFQIASDGSYWFVKY